MLTRGDATGYELKKAFDGSLRQFFDAGFGSIYPALAKLTDEALVECTTLPQEKRPDKKVYRITPRGRLAFLDELAHPLGRDRFRSEFLATLLFADLLEPRHLSDLIDRQLDDYRKALTGLERAEEAADGIGPRFSNGLAAAMTRAALTYLEENRHVAESAALLGTDR
jgi:DNA-binding PadR family transcriptional regulator